MIIPYGTFCRWFFFFLPSHKCYSFRIHFSSPFSALRSLHTHTHSLSFSLFLFIANEKRSNPFYSYLNKVMMNEKVMKRDNKPNSQLNNYNELFIIFMLFVSVCVDLFCHSNCSVGKKKRSIFFFVCEKLNIWYCDRSKNNASLTE